MGEPDLVGTDWVKSDPRPKETLTLGHVYVCLFVTCRYPNRLMKWVETMDGDGVGPGTDIGLVCPRHAPLGGRSS